MFLISLHIVLHSVDVHIKYIVLFIAKVNFYIQVDLKHYDAAPSFLNIDAT